MLLSLQKKEEPGSFALNDTVTVAVDTTPEGAVRIVVCGATSSSAGPTRKVVPVSGMTSPPESCRPVRRIV